MGLSHFCFVFIFLFFPLKVFSLYLQKFRYNFSDFHQIYGGFANDDFSFKLSNSQDDFRSATISFAYIGPKDYPISVELSYNIFTFRGLEGTPKSEQQRSGLLDITSLYHWFLHRKDQDLEIKWGFSWSLYGDLGEERVQKLAHHIFGYPKSVSFRKTPYLGIVYLVGGIEYCWRKLIFTNIHLQASFIGDIFFRTALGLDLRNRLMGLEIAVYAQEIYLRDRNGDYSVLYTTAQAESGFGLFFKTESGHFFAFLDLKLWNWSPILQNGTNYGQNYGVSGFGFRFISSDYHSINQKGRSINKPVFQGSQWLSSSIGWRFGVELPTSYTHGLVWVPRSSIPLSFIVGFSFDDFMRDNNLQALFSWDIWKILFFGIFLEGGASFTFGILHPYIPQLWNKTIRGINIGLGMDWKGGIWFRVFQTQSADYRFLLHAGFTYKPLYWEKFWNKKEAYRSNFFRYYYAGFGLEVRPIGTEVILE